MAEAAPLATLGIPARANTQPWDAAAAGWNQHTALIHDWLHNATQAMLDDVHIGLGARVLDIAAGAGDQTLDIARRVGSKGLVLATDISPGILALAKKNAELAGLTQISTQVADAHSLGLAGTNFDAAVCRLGLMFCRSPLEALLQIRAALRPQGRFSALVFGAPGNNPCLTITFATARRHAALGGAVVGQVSSPFDPGSLMSLGKPGLLQELVQTAGFIDVAIQVVPASFVARSAAHYVDFLRTSASPLIEVLAPLSDSEKQATWCDMTEQLRVFDVPGGWLGPNELLKCIAVSPT